MGKGLDLSNLTQYSFIFYNLFSIFLSGSFSRKKNMFNYLNLKKRENKEARYIKKNGLSPCPLNIDNTETRVCKSFKSSW